MRLLIDIVTAVSPGMRQLATELALAAIRQCPADWDVMVVRSSDLDGFPDSYAGAVESVNPLTGSWRKHWAWSHRTLPSVADRLGADAVFSLGRVSKALAARGATIGTVNDMMPFAPEQVGRWPVVSKQRLRLRVLRSQYVSSLRRADAVILHSADALRRVSAYAGDLSHKSFVVHTGVPNGIRLDEGVPGANPNHGDPYLLYFSVVRHYKNHLALVEAYRRAIQKDASLPHLLLAGIAEDREYLDAVLRAIENAGLTERVRYLGVLPKGDLPAWLHHAAINVFPSALETNSVIQAEILGARGVMACSTNTPMSEVGGDAVALFDGSDPESIASVICELWARPEEREGLRKRARMRAEALSWDECGKTIFRAAAAAVEANNAQSVRNPT